MKKLFWLGMAAVVIAAGGFAFIRFGLYNISAIQQHTLPVYLILERAMLHSVRARAPFGDEPDLKQPELVHTGFRIYQAHCRQCHGAPGVPPDPFALGMTPLPANLVNTARHWKSASVYWAIENGIKMTGMPAWKYRMSEQEIWATTAFVMQLPYLSPVDYQQMVRDTQPGTYAGPSSDSGPTSAQAPVNPVGNRDSAGDIENGRLALSQYACGTCHVIPGVVGARSHVGPPLTGIGKRKYIAGVLPNNFNNMVAWLMNPQRIAPRSAMPHLYVKREHARDMAAYLMTLTEQD